MTDAERSIKGMFAGKDPAVKATYDRLLAEFGSIGPFSIEPRATSVHLVHSVAFAGVHAHQAHLILTLRTDVPVEHPRVQRTEHVSTNRWHIEIKLSGPDEIDEEVRGWLAAAMALE